MTYDRSFFAPCAMTLLLIGCGGSVSIDDSVGAGGQSGVGGAGTTIASSSSGPVIETNCSMACSSLEACGGGFDDCQANCEAIEQSACGDTHQAWLECAFGFTDTLCGTSGGILCEPQLRNYLDCTGKVAGELGCTEQVEGCSCAVFVSPGVEFTQRCDEDGDCECLLGGERSIGFCPGQNLTCDPVANCCAGLFYTGGFN